MKKSILNLGKTLSKTEQLSINGGYEEECGCQTGHCCDGVCLPFWRVCYPTPVGGGGQGGGDE